MRNLLPSFRSMLSLTVLAGIGLAGLLAPWTWTQLLAVVLVVVIVLTMIARNALRRASRRIDTILDEELSADGDSEPARPRHRAAARTAARTVARARPAAPAYSGCQAAAGGECRRSASSPAPRPSPRTAPRPRPAAASWGPAVFGEDRGADRRRQAGDRPLRPVEVDRRDRQVRHHRPDPLGGVQHVVPAEPGQHHRELLAAVAADHVVPAHRMLDRVGHRAQHGVARQVPVPVVDPLEQVEVEQQHAEPPVEPPRAVRARRRRARTRTSGRTGRSSRPCGWRRGTGAAAGPCAAPAR